VKKISKTKALELGKKIGIDFNDIDMDQFRMGVSVELEHRDVTHGNLVTTGRIALAHLNEIPDYYTRLDKLEEGYKRSMKHAKK